MVYMVQGVQGVQWTQEGTGVQKVTSGGHKRYTTVRSSGSQGLKRVYSGVLVECKRVARGCRGTRGDKKAKEGRKGVRVHNMECMEHKRRAQEPAWLAITANCRQECTNKKCTLGS